MGLDPVTAMAGSAIIGGGLSFLGSQSQSRAASNAANAQIAYSQQGATNANTALDTGVRNARNALISGTGDSAINYIQQAAQQAIGSQQTGLSNSLNAINQGTQQAIAAQQAGLTNATAGLNPWEAAGQQALQGQAAAANQYQNVLANPNSYVQSPGYKFALQQGLDALNRSYSASGGLDSGARSKDIVNYAQGLASQDYQNYLNNIVTQGNLYGNLSGMGANTANALAGLYTNQAGNLSNLYANQGSALANQYTGQASNLSNLYSSQGNALAGIYGNLANLYNQQGTNQANIYTGLGATQGNALANQAINQANATTGLYSNLSNIGSNAVNQYMLYNALAQNPQGALITNTSTQLPGYVY